MNELDTFVWLFFSLFGFMGILILVITALNIYLPNNTIVGLMILPIVPAGTLLILNWLGVLKDKHNKQQKNQKKQGERKRQNTENNKFKNTHRNNPGSKRPLSGMDRDTNMKNKDWQKFGTALILSIPVIIAAEMKSHLLNKKKDL